MAQLRVKQILDFVTGVAAQPLSTAATTALGSVNTRAGLIEGDVTALEGNVASIDTRAGLIEGDIASIDTVIGELDSIYATDAQLSSGVSVEKLRAEGIEAGLQSSIDSLVTDSKDYTDDAVAALKQEVDDSVEKILDLDFKSMFAQKIGATTSDNQKYRLDKAVMGESLQVFENGLLLEEGADYSVNYGGGVNDAVDVTFGYQIKPDWKVKFFGVPFVASDVDLIAG